VRDTVARKRLAGEARLRARLREAQRSGELPPETHIGALAKYVASLAQGITVQGAAGVSRRELKAVVKLAMQAWPTQTKPAHRTDLHPVSKNGPGRRARHPSQPST
jgi:hypothetical protein